MFLVGFNLNFVTATIAVGVDFWIHMTERYRQEIGRNPDSSKLENLPTAVTGIGMALVGSGVSGIVGFGVLSLAPMPIISTYGILTAAMILMAAVASLLVLVPSPKP